MKAKLIIVFLIIVLLPIVLLSWMGYRLAGREGAAIEQQFTRLMESRLAGIDGQIKKVVQQREREFDKLLNNYSSPFLSREDYSRAVRKSPLIRQLFILDARGQLSYPKKNGNWNLQEHEFFRRTEGLWQDSLLFDHIKRAEAQENGQDTMPELSNVPQNPPPPMQPDNNNQQLHTSGNQDHGNAAINSDSSSALDYLQQLQQTAKLQQSANVDPNATVRQYSGSRRQQNQINDSEMQQRDQQQRRQYDLNIISNKQYKKRQVPQQKLQAERNVSNVIISGKHQGWYTWYSGSGIKLIFWKHLSDGRIIGVEMSMLRFLSDIIAALPDTDPFEGKESEGRIVLLNSGKLPLYQWGNYQPAKGAEPRLSRPLSYPLYSWHLEIYNDTGALTAGFKKSFIFNLIAGGISVGLVMILLAIYFYRESTRQMREAATKVNFVSSVSHELKTPLTNIRMYAELLEKRLDGEDDKCGRYVGVITSESQRLSRLISNVLTFSKGQRDKLEIRKRRGTIDDCIRGLVDQFRPGFSRKHIRILFNEGIKGETEFDSDVLEQIMVNLFSNIEKYAAEGEFMGITSSLIEDNVLIKVCDRGRGIPSHEGERIFMPFHRLDDRLSEGVSGTGIGLSIARDLARLHGGDLTLEPAEDGVGACFHLTI